MVCKVSSWLRLVLIATMVTVFCCQCSAQETFTPTLKSIEHHGLDLNIYQLALKAHTKASHQNILARNDVITVIDYSKPANEKRLWVINLHSHEVLNHTYVAHGAKSGRGKATQFSNTHGSHQSSLGVFKTGSIYQGKHGLSLYLHGLESNFNSNAYQRKIVMHGAKYVPAANVKKGSAGHSHGCPALSYNDAKKVISTIKEGSMMFIYYPDHSWLKQSAYLV